MAKRDCVVMGKQARSVGTHPALDPSVQRVDAFPPPAAARSYQQALLNPGSLTPAGILALQRTIGNHAVGRLLRGSGAVTASPPIVQRELTWENLDFTKVTTITRLGGAAEGAFLVTDGAGQVVVKPADAPARTMLAQALAVQFGVSAPRVKYVDLESDAGRELLAKAQAPQGGNSDLAKGIAQWKGAVVQDYVQGKTLDKLKGLGDDSEQVGKFQASPANLIAIGRMVVFDAAILNGDRFKVEFEAPTNSGNLMVAEHGPVALDQDFAKLGDEEDVLETYAPMFLKKFATLKLVTDPGFYAEMLVRKLRGEGHNLVNGKEALIEQGIKEGLATLKELAKESNGKLEELIASLKGIPPAADLKADEIRAYWNNILSGEGF